MFGKTVEIRASKKEMFFRCGPKELRFEPVIHLDAGRRVLAIGSPPAQGAVAWKIRIFENDTTEESFALLEATMRYAIRELLGAISFPPIIRIEIGADIRSDLKGYAPAIFHYAATNAGAKRVIIL